MDKIASHKVWTIKSQKQKIVSCCLRQIDREVSWFITRNAYIWVRREYVLPTFWRSKGWLTRSLQWVQRFSKIRADIILYLMLYMALSIPVRWSTMLLCSVKMSTEIASLLDRMDSVSPAVDLVVLMLFLMGILLFMELVASSSSAERSAAASWREFSSGFHADVDRRNQN